MGRNFFILQMSFGKYRENFAESIFLPIFAVPNGTMAEWLGTGLQNLLQRFDSASHLQKLATLCLLLSSSIKNA